MPQRWLTHPVQVEGGDTTYVALFSHFIPCGVWEAVYILDGLLKNRSDTCRHFNRFQ